MALLREETADYKITAGTGSLADVELVALLIGGQPERALEKARNLFKICGTLANAGKMTRRDLIVSGLTDLEANRVISAIELGRRRYLTDLEQRPRISSSADAFKCIAARLTDLHHEEFWLLILNKANEVTDRVQMSIGGQSGTVVDMKLILREAIVRRAAGIILVHNHPSGNIQPSAADMDLTRRAVALGKAADMPVLDHLIVSERGYYSFADEGRL